MIAVQPARTNNFNTYRIIRHHEIPKRIEVHFVENDIDPTGLGEPPFPPVFGELANALHRATGKRFYRQPFSAELSEAQGEDKEFRLLLQFEDFCRCWRPVNGNGGVSG